MTVIADLAQPFADTVVATTTREYPNAAHHVATGPDDRPTNRELHPAFYGCFDWHSAVHMHAAGIRLLGSGLVGDPGALRRTLDAHLTLPQLRAEAAYLRAHPGFERPYGWGWALDLANEIMSLAERGDDAARHWAAGIVEVADVVTDHILAWLPRLDYPVRVGMHLNTAFGLWLALPWAQRLALAGEPRLRDAIVAHGRRLFDADRAYPISWEPQGTEFLSPALTEALLMSEIHDDLGSWLEQFLPGFDLGPVAAPASVADPTDGHIAHLAGLNLSRAWHLGLLAAALGPDDPRAGVALRAARANRDASLDLVTGGDYMVEHWLVTYAIGALAATQ